MNRIGIVGPLSEIERLAKEYIEEVVKDDPLVSWRITDFLLWVKRRQDEQRKEKSSKCYPHESATIIEGEGDGKA